MTDSSGMEARSTGPAPQSDSAKFLKMAAGGVGAVFLVVGILGFVPGVTTNYDQLKFAGPDSEAQLLGVFQVSWLHNIVHLLFGVVGLAVAARAVAAAWYLIIGGLVYGVLWLYGLVVGNESNANFVPLDTADNWLHLGLTVGMLALGAVGYRGLRGSPGAQSPR